MTDEEKRREERKKKEEKRKTELQRSREHQRQELLHKRKFRTLHDKHRDRRKKDCMIGLPFVIAFQGDPAQNFFCNDIHSYELIHDEVGRTDSLRDKAFYRLIRYMDHHVVTMHAKVLIYKAGNLCPVCGIGNLLKGSDGIVRCNYCGYRPDRQFLRHS